MGPLAFATSGVSTARDDLDESDDASGTTAVPRGTCRVTLLLTNRAEGARAMPLSHQSGTQSDGRRRAVGDAYVAVKCLILALAVPVAPLKFLAMSLNRADSLAPFASA